MPMTCEVQENERIMLFMRKKEILLTILCKRYLGRNYRAEQPTLRFLYTANINS
jgi:hypothetical protein